LLMLPSPTTSSPSMYSCTLPQLNNNIQTDEHHRDLTPKGQQQPCVEEHASSSKMQGPVTFCWLATSRSRCPPCQKCPSPTD
jgi:hypothetical protein